MIPRATALRVYARTFLLQAGWNYDRMQHLGMAYAMLPALRRIHPAPEAQVAAARRHLEYFNTHPFLAPVVLGAALNLEEEVALGKRRPDEVVSFKNGIMGSYGAIGDSFFWAALRPFFSVVAFSLILIGAGPWGPVVLVVAFDAIALALRTYGFFAGLRLGPLVVARLAQLDFAGATRLIKMSSAALAGLAAALWASTMPAVFEDVSAEMVAFPLVVLLAATARRGVSPATTAVLLAMGVAAWTFFGPGGPG